MCLPIERKGGSREGGLTWRAGGRDAAASDGRGRPGGAMGSDGRRHRGGNRWRWLSPTASLGQRFFGVKDAPCLGGGLLFVCKGHAALAVRVYQIPVRNRSWRGCRTIGAVSFQTAKRAGCPRFACMKGRSCSIRLILVVSSSASLVVSPASSVSASLVAAAPAHPMPPTRVALLLPSPSPAR